MTEPFVTFEKPTVCMEFSVWEDRGAVPAAGFLSSGEESGFRAKPVSGREDVVCSVDLACDGTGAVIGMMYNQVTISLTRQLWENIEWC